MKSAISVFFAALFLVAPGLAGAASYFEVDASHSTVIFKVKHLGVSYAYGRFNEMRGKVTFDQKSPPKSSIEFEIPAASVDTANDKRDQHLKSPDFFNAKQFPVIKFSSGKIKSIGKNKYRVSGKLTLNGVSKDISMEVEHTGSAKDPWGGYRAGFHSEFKIKRSDFGMNFMPGGIGDDVQLMVSIEAIKKS